MANTFAEAFAQALHDAGSRAREAAGATSDTYLCRECDSRWVSSDPICWLCGNVTPQARSTGQSLDDPLVVDKPSNLGMEHTRFEATGLG